DVGVPQHLGQSADDCEQLAAAHAHSSGCGQRRGAGGYLVVPAAPRISGRWPGAANFSKAVGIDGAVVVAIDAELLQQVIHDKLSRRVKVLVPRLGRAAPGVKGISIADMLVEVAS